MSNRPWLQWKSLLLIVLMIVNVVATAWAATGPATVLSWRSGTKINTVAATCTGFWPDNRPFQVPRTIQVDNSMPNGTVLYSWDYVDFLPNMGISCTSGTLNDQATTSTPYPPVEFYVYLSAPTKMTLTVNGTAVPVQLKLYVRNDGSFPSCAWPDMTCVSNNTGFIKGNVIHTWPFAGNEGPLDSTVSSLGSGQKGNIFADSKGVNWIGFASGTMPTLSVRAELIKTGNFTASMYGPAKSNSDLIYVYAAQTSDQKSLLGGLGITLAPAGCRLRTKDYTIPMGNWSATDAALPAEGPTVPVALATECNGAVNNVKFMFQDAGSSPSTSGRVSLYDANGNKIDGLSIALSYNGTSVPVDGATYFNAGAFGQKSPDQSYQPANDATFSAKYVQDKPGITRSGTNYSGAVSGKVNMFVTYN
ncbi:hypothetical protein VL10_14615 [Leclercia adecarboxylata]|nr:hypothetical protein VL10_14615 [Leclercia adecarboxylata]KMN63672.1 hypothetical protein VK95_18390 [Leclercia sp. LK8]